jgi:hypothetical protein
MSAAKSATLWPFRAVLTVHVALLVTQPILIGLFLAGDFDKLSPHAVVGGVIIAVCMVQGITAFLLWLPGRHSLWPLLLTVAMFFAEAAQLVAGYARNLGLHVPLGVALVVLSIQLLIWAWHPRRRTA